MKNLFRICVILGAVGVALIYSSSIYIEPEKVNISEIEPQWNGRQVKVGGKAVQPYKSKGNLFFNLKDNSGKIKVAKFDADITLNKSESVNVSGRVKLYQGKLELVAENIER